MLGAEKLKPELVGQIREAWGIEPLQGYGCTETGPVVSVNSPLEHRGAGGRAVAGNRSGTVGQPLPGTAAKTVDPETGLDLPDGAEGVVCVKGPQVMLGYLDRPDATAEVLRDGWYSTGDLGHLDEDGFLVITDRLSRFSKIGGEMVPHRAVEAAVLEAAGGLRAGRRGHLLARPQARRAAGRGPTPPNSGWPPRRSSAASKAARCRSSGSPRPRNFVASRGGADPRLGQARPPSPPGNSPGSVGGG